MLKRPLIFLMIAQLAFAFSPTVKEAHYGA
jgi:hypothetical protein